MKHRAITILSVAVLSSAMAGSASAQRRLARPGFGARGMRGAAGGRAPVGAMRGGAIRPGPGLGGTWGDLGRGGRTGGQSWHGAWHPARRPIERDRDFGDFYAPSYGFGLSFGDPFFANPYDSVDPYFYPPDVLSPYSFYSPFTYGSPYVPGTQTVVVPAPNQPIIIQEPRRRRGRSQSPPAPAIGPDADAARIQQQWTGARKLRVTWEAGTASVDSVAIALVGRDEKVQDQDVLTQPPFDTVFSKAPRGSFVRVTVRYRNGVKSATEIPLLARPQG